MNEVSIIMPAYNAEAYISYSISSVISQTYKNWELIVIDDGSTDTTAKIIKRFVEEDYRIKYYWQENGRQGKARNFGITKSRGNLIAFLDADDLWAENKLEKQMSVFEEQNVDMVFSAGWIFYGNDLSRLENYESVYGLQFGKPSLLKLFRGNYIPNLSVLVKREVLVQVGGFSEVGQIQNAEDFHLWLRILDKGYKMFGLQERLFFYRKHESQSTHSDPNVYSQIIYAINSTAFNLISKKEKRKVLAMWCERYFRAPIKAKDFRLIHSSLQGIYPRFFDNLLLATVRITKSPTLAFYTLVNYLKHF